MENYNLYIRTVQSQSIKILVESLKEVLTDINLYFDSNGLKIMTMDNVRVALVYVRLIKDNFEEYVCNNKIMCGINMIYFFKLLKTVGNNDVLTLFIKSDSYNELGIRIENKEKNTIMESYLKISVLLVIKLILQALILNLFLSQLVILLLKRLLSVKLRMV